MGSCPDTDIDPIKALKQLFGFFLSVFCLSVRNFYSYLAVTNVKCKMQNLQDGTHNLKKNEKQ